MADFPKGHAALVAAGYHFLGQGACKAEGCGYQIYWYRAPSGQIMPIDAGSQLPHWRVCVNAKKFRKRKREADPPPESQRNLFEREPGED